uniref:Uncharacterized protein n=1 Tax=Paramormyrops kingsleyae TaxID=1676925 RepID=A0A3B3QCR5_9TELE
MTTQICFTHWIMASGEPEIVTALSVELGSMSPVPYDFTGPSFPCHNNRLCRVEFSPAYLPSSEGTSDVLPVFLGLLNFFRMIKWKLGFVHSALIICTQAN